VLAAGERTLKESLKTGKYKPGKRDIDHFPVLDFPVFGPRKWKFFSL
jgi:hypothetical protein